MTVIQKIKANWYLILLIILAAFLRFFHIDFQSLWIDEINTMVQADPSQSFTGTYKILLENDVQPPLYFYVLKTMFLMFGYTSVVLRSLSAILGVAAIYAIYLLGTEIRNKRTGLIAATILCFNFIHLFYSQEARPYTWLILFSTLSFYQLIKFIKQPGYKSALMYGLFTALMLYGHAYGLFNLGAQAIILTYYLMFYVPVTQRFLFFKYAVVAAIITVVLYLPALPLLLIAGNVTSSWIPMPPIDVYTRAFKDFFGNFELLIVLISLLYLFFFIKFFLGNTEENKELNTPFSETNAFVFILLMVWILVPLLIALIRTYLTIPMIVPRYLLGLLPALIIILALTLDMIKANHLRNFLVLLIVVFSAVDIFAVKKYYFRHVKSDMRGVTEIVSANQKDSDIIVSQIAWHYSYYFKNFGVQKPLILNNLNNYVEGIKADTNNLKTFWFVDRGAFLDGLTENNRQFLSRYFRQSKNIIKTEAYGVYFTPLSSNSIFLDLNNFDSVKPDAEGQLSFFQNKSAKSAPVLLDAGVYRLLISGTSKPKKPINNVNAHISIKLNGIKIGGAFLSETEHKTIKVNDFKIYQKQDVVFELIFDNDINLNHKDRNAYVSEIELVKIK